MNLHRHAPPRPRRLGKVPSVVALLALVAGGCEYREESPRRTVPLESRPPAPVPAVAVSFIVLTDWIWFPWAVTHSARPMADRGVRIERVELVDPDRATVYVPRGGGSVVWGLAFIRAEDPGIALFRPGFDPGYFDGHDVWGIAPESSPAFGRSVVFTAPPLRAAPATAAAAPSSPDSRAGGDDSLAALLAQQNFWRALRERYEAGRDRAAIRVVCETIARAADDRDAARSTGNPKDDERASVAIAWCRSVAAQAPAR